MSARRYPLRLLTQKTNGVLRFSWFYRILPAVLHAPFSLIKSELITNQWDKSEPNPNQTRWKPFKIPSVEDEKKDFLDVKSRQERVNSVEHGMVVK